MRVPGSDSGSEAPNQLKILFPDTTVLESLLSACLFINFLGGHYRAQGKEG